ncbi:MAG: hypothetical protein ABFE08_17430 [Armatimonadia bacterium]
MRTKATAVLVLAALALGCFAAPAPVYVRGNDGKWRQLTPKQDGRNITVNLAVEQIGSGYADLVVDKPAWMVLDDGEAPKLAWMKLNGKEVGVAPSIDLGALTALPATLSFGLKDNANPLDPASAAFVIPNAPSTPKVDVAELGPPKINGRMSVVLPTLPAGRYHALLRVADASPAANALEVPVAFSIVGFHVSPDQQTVVAGTPGGSFTLKAVPHETLRTGTGAAAYLTANVQGQHMYLAKIIEVQTLCDTPQLKSVRVIGVPGETDKGQDGSKLCRLEYDLSIRPDLPCLLVTSRIVNLGPEGGLYCWWGWLPGLGFVDSTGEHQWAMEYKGVGKVGWVYLPSGKPELDSIGWISPLAFGESRSGTMLLYTEPQTISNVKTGAAVELPFALMAANSAEEVRAVAEKLNSLKVW